MQELIIALVAFLLISAILAYVESKLKWISSAEVPVVIGLFLSLLASLFLAVALCSLGFNYRAAGYKTKILNREYGTDYTQQEIFYAGDVVETIKNLDRQRVEINGNLFTGEQVEKKE